MKTNIPEETNIPEKIIYTMTDIVLRRASEMSTHDLEEQLEQHLATLTRRGKNKVIIEFAEALALERLKAAGEIVEAVE